VFGLSWTLTDSRSQQYNSVMASPGLPTIVKIIRFEVFSQEYDGVDHGFRVKLFNDDVEDVQANDPRLTREMVETFLWEQTTDQVRKWIGVAKFINFDVGTRPKHKCITKLMMWFDEAQGSVSSLNKGGQECVSLPNTTAIPVLMQESTVDGKDIWMPFVGLVSEDVNADQTRNIALAQYTKAGFETDGKNFQYYGYPTKNWQCSVRNGNIARVTNNETNEPERAHTVFPYQITKVICRVGITSPTCIVKVQGGNQILVDPCFIHVPGFFNVDGDRNKPYLCTDLTGSRSYKDIYFRLRNQWEECTKLKANHVHANCIDLTTDFTPPDTRLSKQPTAAKPPACPDSDTPDGAAQEGELVGDISSMQVDFIAESEDANNQATGNGSLTPTISPSELNAGGVIEAKGGRPEFERSVMPPDSPDQEIQGYVNFEQIKVHQKLFNKDGTDKEGLPLVDVCMVPNGSCAATYMYNREKYTFIIPDTNNDEKRKEYFRCFDEKFVFFCLNKIAALRKDEDALNNFWWYWVPRELKDIFTEHNEFWLVYNSNADIAETELHVSLTSETEAQRLTIGYIVWTCNVQSFSTLKTYLAARFDKDSDEQKKAIDDYVALVREIWGGDIAEALMDNTLAPRQPRIQLQLVDSSPNRRQKRHREDDPNNFAPNPNLRPGSPLGTFQSMPGLTEFNRLWEEELQSDLSDRSLSAEPGLHNDSDKTGGSPGGSPDTPRLCVEAISIHNIYNKAMKFDPSACKALNAMAPSDQFAVSNHTFEFGVPSDLRRLGINPHDKAEWFANNSEQIRKLQDVSQQYLVKANEVVLAREKTAIIVMNKYRVKKMLGWLRSYTNNKVHENNLVTDCKEKFDEALANAQNTLDSLKRKYGDLFK